ncbi:hypothetical protein RRG08_021431 [Elysia crispata]|uniref:Uncharacterized protein n=1 Tax=Elysia crispata TaxID=231223 RepID=A0AAE1DTI6_9GAST|nr:hypothetical protein RRG08_021431 [Elysia crispata]
MTFVTVTSYMMDQFPQHDTRLSTKSAATYKRAERVHIMHFISQSIARPSERADRTQHSRIPSIPSQPGDAAG